VFSKAYVQPLGKNLETSGRQRAAWWIPALLGLVGFLGSLFPLTAGLLWDEAANLATAENLFHAHPYYTGPAYAPPLLPLLLKAGSLLMPLELFAHLLSAASFAGALVFLYLLGRKLYGTRAGMFAAGLMLVSLFYRHFAHKVMNDIPATCLFLASLYFLWPQGEDEEPAPPWMGAVAGVLLAVAVLTRFVLVLGLVAALCLLAARRLRLRSALCFGGGFAAGMVPYLVWAQVQHGNALAPFLEARFMLGSGGPVPGNLYYLTATWIIAGPATLLGLLCYFLLLRHGHWRSYRQDDEFGFREWLLLVWYAVFFLYLTSTDHKEILYLVPAVPPLFLLAGRGFARCRSRGQAIVAGVLALAAVLYPLTRRSYFDGTQNLGESILLNYSAQTRQAAPYLQRELPTDQVLYAPSLYPVVAYYSKRPTVPLWPTDESFYRTFPRNMPQDGYLVVYKPLEKEPNIDWLDHRAAFRRLREMGDILIYAYTAPR
jgi:4-amino-4-deoxy-L-arabinose transferase-like glycosyltransferase